MICQRSGFNDAFIVHDGPGQSVSRLGGEEDRAAVGLNQSPVRDEGVDGALFYGEVHELVAGKVEVDFIARGYRHGAVAGGQYSLIGDRGGDKGDIAAVRCPDGALAVNTACRTGLFKEVFSGQKVLIGKIQRGGHKTPDIYGGGRTEIDSRGIYQKDLAVGRKGTKNPAWILIENPVERHARCARLSEGDRGILANVERIPVGDHFISLLMHRHGASRLGDAAASRDNPAARGQGVYIEGPCGLRHKDKRSDGGKAAETDQSIRKQMSCSCLHLFYQIRFSIHDIPPLKPDRGLEPESALVVEIVGIVTGDVAAGVVIDFVSIRSPDAV